MKMPSTAIGRASLARKGKSAFVAAPCRLRRPIVWLRGGRGRSGKNIASHNP